MRALGRRLEDLSPDSTLVDNRSSAHFNPNGIGNHHEDGHLTPQNPFSNHENIVATRDGQNIDEIVTHTPPSHPFVDPAPPSQMANEISDAYLASGELVDCCLRQAEHRICPTIELECGLAGDAETFSMGHGVGDARAGTRDNDQDFKICSTSSKGFDPREIASIDKISVVEEDLTPGGINPFEVGSDLVEDVNNVALAATQGIAENIRGADVCSNAKAKTADII